MDSYDGLENLEIYKMAMEIGEQVWSIVVKWDGFNKYSLGTQLVSAADSIANNLSEGYGRYHYKERKQFCYYARGSMFETYTELTKAKARSLIDDVIFNSIAEQLNILKPKLNAYINSIGK
ncbi:MAG: four helix bundle protein [Fimbriimonadaceae bacterium]|nr:four helix bundle protein [Chitinophagales bacterium]